MHKEHLISHPDAKSLMKQITDIVTRNEKKSSIIISNHVHFYLTN